MLAALFRFASSAAKRLMALGALLRGGALAHCWGLAIQRWPECRRDGLTL